jgi:glycosyltransferase involved in cell wall biosynthesis
MVVVADVNTLWRSRPFEALAELRPVLGLKPMDVLVAMRERRLPFGAGRAREQKMNIVSVVLPLGWASRRAEKGMRRLWSAAVKASEGYGTRPSALVVTSPHYVSLVRELNSTLPTFYYCSDDYVNYSGWKPRAMRQQELEILRHVRHAFFVSAALRDRAINELGAEPSRSSVSMNATSLEFAAGIDGGKIADLLRQYPRLRRPVAGVIGSVGERLDLAILLQVASMEEIGALVLVGPVHPGSRTKQMEQLLNHPKVVSVGSQPQESMPAWHQLLDVGLIPYCDSSFNYYCSPLRLFDHLAAGRPVVATSACPQVLEFAEHVTVAEKDSDFFAGVRSALAQRSDPSRMEAQRGLGRRETWIERAVALSQQIG